MDMQSVLFQLIASRTGGQGNPGMASLFASMQGGAAAPALNAADVYAKLRASGTALPEWMDKLLSPKPPDMVDAEAYRTAESSPEQDEDVDEGASDFAERAAGRAGSSADEPPAADKPGDARGKSGKMMDELWLEWRELKRRNDTLAAALGACHECWGSRGDCHVCLGEGSPGWKSPNMKLFSTWILPAIRVVRAKKDQSTTDPGGAKVASADQAVNPQAKGDPHESI